jgi:hypothetical protein
LLVPSADKARDAAYLLGISPAVSRATG